MKPARKPNSTRKPPVATGDHAVIDDWIAQNVLPGINPVVTYLDELIGNTIPDLQYAIKWKKAYYGLADLGWVIELAAYDVSMNIVFLGGEDFDPPPPLGDTDRSRYLKLRNLDEARAPEVEDWIAQAGRVPGWI